VKEIAQAALAQAQVKFAEQKAAKDVALAAAAQAADTGPSVVQCPASASGDLPPQVLAASETSAPKISHAKPSKQPKQECIRMLRKTLARQARVSLRVSK
jgi:hypothetical protein